MTTDDRQDAGPSAARAQISYDLVMDSEMSFVEGAYRLPEGDWQVFIFIRKSVAEAQATRPEWRNGATGLFVEYPKSAPLNGAIVERFLSAVLGVDEWEVVRGPNSMQLR